MKFTTFFCVVLVLVVKIEEIHSFYVTGDQISRVISPKKLKDPKWTGFSTGILQSNGLLDSYENGKEYTVILSAPPGFVVFAAIRTLDLRPRGMDNLTLFVEGKPAINKTYQNDGFSQDRFEDDTETQKTFLAYNGQLGVTFKTGNGGSTANYEGFVLVYTVQANATCSDKDYFTCKNGKCINHMLRCDGHNHCGDRSDQDDCSDVPFIPNDFVSKVKKTAGQIAGIVCGVLFGLIVIAGVIIFIIVRRASARRSTQGTVVGNQGYR